MRQEGFSRAKREHMFPASYVSKVKKQGKKAFRQKTGCV
jgi:hypothetical protein